MRKILLLGIFDSTYIVHFINDVLIPLDYEVFIMPDSKEINNQFIENHHLHVILSIKKNFKNPFFRKLYNILKTFKDIHTLKQLGKFDFIHIHYVSFKALFIGTVLKRFSKSKLIATYWGSDILRDVNNERKRNSKYLEKVDFISSDSLSSKIVFNELYNSLNLSVIYFGDSICNEIEKLDKNSINDYKKELGIPNDKTIVTIGYNARPAQQHLKVVSSIIESNSSFNDFFFILPMTYCREDEEYIEKLNMVLRNCNLNYLIFDSYMNENQVAKLRLISDIFINAQTTDAFCNTVKEYFYLGKIILNPIWLNYPELSEWKLKTVVYSDFNEIPEKILNHEQYINEPDLKFNSFFFANKLNWSNCREQWKRVYDTLSDSILLSKN